MEIGPTFRVVLIGVEYLVGAIDLFIGCISFDLAVFVDEEGGPVATADERAEVD